jgi:hypothetical protein
MRTVSWRTLSDTRQQELKRALEGHGSAGALMFSPHRAWPSQVWRVGSCLLGLWLAVRWLLTDFGVPLRDHALSGSSDAWGLLVGGGLLTISATAWLDEHIRRRAAPWQPGTYALPTQIVDACSEKLKIYPLSELSHVKIQQHVRSLAVTFWFDKKKVELLLSGPGRREALAAFGKAQRLAEVARAVGKTSWLNRRDLFADIAAHSTGEAPRTPSPLALRLSGSLLLIILILPVAQLRGLLSDARVVQSIQAAPTTKSWEWYLSMGGRQQVAASEWLQAARRREDEQAFSNALALGTSTALQHYLLNGHTIHAAEIRTELLPQAELEEAISASSIRALRRFIQKHRDTQPERVAAAESAVSRAYATQLERLMHQTRTSDRKMRQVFQEIFAWQEAHESDTLQVVFERPDGADLQELDRRMQRAYRSDCAEVAPLASQLSSAQSELVESAVFTALQRALATVVTEEVMTLQRTEGQPAGSSVVISYAISSDGSVYESETDQATDQNRTCYTGLQFNYSVTIASPNSRRPYTFRFRAKPPSHFQVQYRASSLFRGAPPSTTVYAEMTRRAFDNLAVELRDRLFQPDSAAYNAMFDVMEDGR